MKKEAYYFPHFCNARHDRKIKRVRMELGIEGYGIFFMLLETLRDQTDYLFPLADLDLLAVEFGTSEAKIRTVVCNYGLFEIDNSSNFFSSKLIVFLQPYLDRKEKASNAAKARWDARAMLEHNSSNAQAMQRKEKKRKEKYTPEFEKAWKDYGRKGSKKLSYAEWKLLDKEEQDAAIVFIPFYIGVNEPKYRKDFERFLKHKAWEDKPMEMQEKELTDEEKIKIEVERLKRVNEG